MTENALKLLDALCEAYDLHQVPRDGKTFCNFAVQHVCGRMGYQKFKGMMANQMVDFLRRSPDWSEIQMAEAQALANAGRLVVAGMQDNPHGHVVVIRPGLEEVSGKWGMKAPKACNVGGRSYIGKSLSWAFQKIPQIWVLKEAT